MPDNLEATDARSHFEAEPVKRPHNLTDAELLSYRRSQALGAPIMVDRDKLGCAIMAMADKTGRAVWLSDALLKLWCGKHHPMEELEALLKGWGFCIVAGLDHHAGWNVKKIEEEPQFELRASG